MLAPERRIRETVPEVVGVQVKSTVLPAVAARFMLVKGFALAAKANRGEARRAARV